MRRNKTHRHPENNVRVYFHGWSCQEVECKMPAVLVQSVYLAQRQCKCHYGPQNRLSLRPTQTATLEDIARQHAAALFMDDRESRGQREHRDTEKE